MTDLIAQITDWDNFFYYGDGELEDECEFDLYQLLLQPKRSLYYNRRESAGVTEYENNPNSLSLQVNARYEIASAIAYRNSIVVNGSNNTKDRRMAVSQNTIGFEARNGDLNIKILYILYSNFENPQDKSFPLVR